jgi:hypothetical protein
MVSLVEPVVSGAAATSALFTAFACAMIWYLLFVDK